MVNPGGEEAVVDSDKSSCSLSGVGFAPTPSKDDEKESTTVNDKDETPTHAMIAALRFRNLIAQHTKDTGTINSSLFNFFHCGLMLLSPRKVED